MRPVFVLLLLFITPLGAAPLSLELDIYGTLDQTASGALFASRDSGNRESLEKAWVLRGEHQGGHLLWSDQGLQELYYDTQLWGEEITLGKRVVSWGVGQGYRPLDFVQQHSRRRLRAEPQEGVWLLALDHFTENATWSLLYAEESLALRYWSLLEETDLHLQGRVSVEHGLQLGGGFSQVMDRYTEWHGSLLWSDRYQQSIHRLSGQSSVLLSTENPFVSEQHSNGVALLLGGSWSGEGGLSLLVEGWYDGSAYSGEQWNGLQQLARAQRQKIGDSLVSQEALWGNLEYNRQAYLPNNLHRWNLLLRGAWSREGVEPAAEWLYTPEDGGWVATARLSDEGNQSHLEAGWRYFGGAGDSVYRNGADQQQLYIGWKYYL